MAEAVVKMTREAKTAILTIQNPPVNVLTAQVRDELHALVRAVAADPEIITVIFTGAGEKAFMAGGGHQVFSPDVRGIRQRIRLCAHHICRMG